MSLIHLYRKQNNTQLFTTPSHGQKFFITSKFEKWYRYDISETDTHNPQDALLEAEKHASEIYNTKSTKFLTNGSTSGVIAAVLSCVKAGENVLVWRNSHICHKNAIKLAGANPIFYDIETSSNTGTFEPVNLKLIKELFIQNKISAMILTSPNYEGIISDIEGFKNLCCENNAKLIVDEAHGALYPFCEQLPKSAVNIADFTIQSLHKTAGGLNPTALVHCNCELTEELNKSLEMINTTSPSYPLLMTIEKNINFLNSKKGRAKIIELLENIKELKNNCNGYEFFGNDETKIIIKHPTLNGFELSEQLFENGIEDEKTNEKTTMLLCGIGTNKQKLKRLEVVLKKIIK